MMHEDVSPSWDSNFGSLVLIRVFLIHLAVHRFRPFLLHYCCYIPAIYLVPWLYCKIITAWESDPPESAHLESALSKAWTLDLLYIPYIGPCQTLLLLVFIGTVVLIETCMGSMPDSLQCVNILRHSTDANPQSRKRIFGWQAMCILIVLIP